MLVEVCCNSLESAINAQSAGADRIELCSELGVGGITPSSGLIQQVQKHINIPIHVLLRPRSGHFTYTDTEFEVMHKDIEVCIELGVDGIVSGALNSDNTIAIEKTKILISKSKPLHFTFHRAFDWIDDQKKALLQLEELGIDTVLTSGKLGAAKDAINQLKELKRLSSRITIMPGGGVNAANVSAFKKAEFKAIHFSGSSFVNQVDTSTKITMNSKKHFAENEVAVTNEKIVSQIVQLIK